MVSSVWHVYLPGQGTFMIDQTENYWSYICEVVVPARMSSGDNWRGAFHGVMTSGPGALGTARVTGGSGLYRNLESEAAADTRLSTLIILVLIGEIYEIDPGLRAPA